MVTKLLSLAAAITTVDISVRGRMDPTAPLYYFVSNRMLINLMMFAVIGAGVAVSFKSKNRFKSWYSYAACAAGSVFLITVGLLGMLLSNFTFSGWGLLLPLDYVLLLETGIVLAISALSYRHVKRPAYFSSLIPALKVPDVTQAAARGFKSAYAATREAGSSAAPTVRRRARA